MRTAGMIGGRLIGSVYAGRAGFAPWPGLGKKSRAAETASNTAVAAAPVEAVKK